MRTFLDLLPFRVDQMLASRAVRKLRVDRRRAKGTRQAPAPVAAQRCLYVDIAVISRNDAGTGIQRVVRALALALIEEAGERWNIRFVAGSRRRGYHVISWPDSGQTPVDGSVTIKPEIEGRPGDVFLGLDFSLDTVRFQRQQLARFRRKGGILWFLVCDLLPVDRPGWFSPNNVLRFKIWLEILAGIADGFLCISSQTKLDLQRVLEARFGLGTGYRTSIVPMGYSIKESMLQSTLSAADVPVRFDTSRPFSLMVGTLEPRKGHADILAAFEVLWRRGAEDRLVLVGRSGWATEDLGGAIRSHSEYGGKLLWLDDVEDLELERIYQACQGVIIASHAEGFGLPLIEALGHCKSVLARDLPIFREHEHRGVRYFPVNGQPEEIADCIASWIDDVQAWRITVTPPNTGWKQSARTILSALEQDAEPIAPAL